MTKRLGLLLLLLPLLVSGCAVDEGLYTATLVWQGERQLSDATLPGDLVVIDGRAHLPAGATLQGGAVVLGGTLSIDGTVGGDITILDGHLILGPTAVIDGDLRLGGGSVDRSPGAAIGGQQGAEEGLGLPLGEAAAAPAPGDLWRRLPGWLLLAAAAALLGRFAPGPLRRVGQTTAAHPLISIALGLLVVLVAPALLVLMAFTLVLIPLALALFLFLLAAGIYGLLGLSYQGGRLLARRLALAPSLATFVSAFALFLLLDVLRLLPLAGDLLALLLPVAALGAVFLTRFGARPYIPPAAGEAEDLASYERPR